MDALQENFRTKHLSPLVAIVTQSPKIAGRNKKLKYSEVDHWAYKHHIPVIFNPEEIIENNYQADMGILASYGAIIPKSVIDFFPYGILNIHPSLLPEFRGSSPVQAAIATGKNVTGSTIMLLDEKLDHGPIVAQLSEEITADDTTSSLRNRLFQKSAEMLVRLIPPYIERKISVKPQDHTKATFTRQINKENAYIEASAVSSAIEGKTIESKWNIPFIKNFVTYYSPVTIMRYINAMTPWPLAWTRIRLHNNEEPAKRLIIHKAHLKDDRLILDEVQLEGKSVVNWKQMREGYPQLEITS